MWIREFREAHGLDVDELARRVRMVADTKAMRRGRDFPVNCSAELIYKLETSATPRTHPHIADVIAAACGATAEQRDSIVDKSHRGTWRGDGRPKALDFAAPALTKRAAPDRSYGKTRTIVKIDPEGRVVERYISVTQAARRNFMSDEFVDWRCVRNVKSEFAPMGYSFRYAEEWDRMKPEERTKDLLWVSMYARKNYGGKKREEGA